ncbi:MAG: response regulator [Verrucomicrobia bacterium]|nr:response regulator [Verrucomicrobiota bacterium]
MKKILLVEDDDAFADILRKSLTMSGYDVMHARDGREALHRYDPQTVHLVITDLIMPGVDGMELIVKLQRINPAVRIIAITGGGRCDPETYLLIAKRLGAVKMLAKPFPLEEIRAAVKECLDIA